jgi:hypothetical protein
LAAPVNQQRTLKTNILIIALSTAFFAAANGQTNQTATTTDTVVTKDAVPAPATNEIVTRYGATYEHAEILRVQPDGMTIGYVPRSGGIGIVKIPLGYLSDDFQEKYGYDSKKAAEYELEQQKMIGRWREQMIADEAAAKAKREAEEKAALAAQQAAEEATNTVSIQVTNSPQTNVVQPVVQPIVQPVVQPVVKQPMLP